LVLHKNRHMETIIMDFLSNADDNPFHTAYGSPLATASPLVDPIPSSSSSRKKKSALRYGPRDSLRSRYKIGKPGSRRYRNWENEFFLVKNLSETESEYDSVYSDDWDSSCEPSFGSFALVLDDENREHWDAFIDITEEQQNILLGFYDNESSDDEYDYEYEYEDDNDSNSHCLAVSADEAFTNLRNCTRRTLTRFKDSSLLQEIDETIFSYSNGLLFSLGRDYLRHDETEDALIFSFPEKFHRLLLHSICEYYDLVSYSVDMTEERKTVVYKRPKTLVRQTSLVSFMNGLVDLPSKKN